ncbi:MAG: assimilatory sulfite reductase (NADPH) flavoprotein subunit [Immundisolibacter sp.]|uniref:assimilatory sulfite reductase (NADPH) flavoprotein subunit n=1 Tax=Immundisolibacter sp. TaxID=1934948 RepID=UPI003D146E2A
MNAPITAATTPLTDAQAERLQALVAELSSAQLLWLSGYLAARAQFGGEGPIARAASAASTLTVLYGSQSGNGARLARRLAELAQARGLSVTLSSTADYKPARLRDERMLALIVSTHGEGEPPDSARELHEYLHGRKAPRLEALRYSVLALGDSSYQFYCQTGKDFDAALEKQGAQRLLARVDCDVDYDDAAAAWIDQLVGALDTAPAGRPSSAHVASVGSTQYDKRRPFQAEVLENLNLNGRGANKETRHVELAVPGLAYTPGDALGVLAQNNPALVGELLAALKLSADAPVAVGEGSHPLAQALTSHFEITALTRPFLAGWAELTQSARLRGLLEDGNDAALRAYLAGRQIIDVVQEFPLPGIEPGQFTGLLRRLPPRLYSLASSLAACPDEAHITVAAVRYESLGRPRAGVASTWLADHVRPGDTVPVFIESNENFRLPADPAAPIVMIGPGTGVAPFRAFLQEREALGAGGRNWLFFGDRHFHTDFLYQTDWQAWLKSGLLTRMDVAFSRDQAEKIYVQQRLRERAAELYAWLQDGAHVYVCGDATAMAADVHAALRDVVAGEGHLGAEAAEEYLRELARQRRYQRDIY